MLFARQNCTVEWSFDSAQTYEDPFNDVQVDVVVSTPEGAEQTVPAFWAGEQTWTVRYSSLDLALLSVQLGVCIV